MPQPIASISSRPKLRVPSDDGGILIEPSVGDARTVIASNTQRILAAGQIDLQGRTLDQLRQTARGEIVGAAVRYTSSFRDSPDVPAIDEPLIFTGHQPELFHPGVWIKNFVAAQVATESSGSAINLVVDNDFCEGANVRVPATGPRGIRPQRVPIEREQVPQPWEERLVTDADALASFPKRIAAAIKEWDLPEPIVGELWKNIGDITPGTRLADVLTRLRSLTEVQRGVRNLELPISRMCETESFLRFVCHLLVNAERFHSVHNQAIIDYRRRNGLRSKTHPVPELEQTPDGWWETPFWSWRKGERERKRLFARQKSDKVLAISDGTRVLAELPVGPDMDACCAVEILMQLASAGERIRTRALTTTIFSRLLVSDLFIHGIGGAKYDEMTDAILRDFYYVEPPDFMTVSATLRLLGHQATDVTHERLDALRHQARRLRFSPEEFLSAELEPRIMSLVREKKELLAEQQLFDTSRTDNASSDENRERYRRFKRLNRELAKDTVAQQSLLDEEIVATRFELEQNKQRRSRDASFCLFPAKQLWSLLDQVAQ